MTPLAILLERAEAVMLTHGPAAQDEMLRQIASAVRNDDDPGKVRDLDHVLQLLEYRERMTGANQTAELRGWAGSRATPPLDLRAKPSGA